MKPVSQACLEVGHTLCVCVKPLFCSVAENFDILPCPSNEVFVVVTGAKGASQRRDSVRDQGCVDNRDEMLKTVMTAQRCWLYSALT